MLEVIVFVIAAAACLVGAIGVVMSGNAVHGALRLVLTLFGVAVLFVAQDAHFLAAVQVIVYAGAVVVLFLFVIMLLGVDRNAALQLRSLRTQIWAAFGFAVGSLAVVAGAIALVDEPTTGQASVGGVLAEPNTEATYFGIANLGNSLFSDYLYAFELTSLLLVVAVVGTVVLARRTAEHTSAPPSPPSPPPASLRAGNKQ